MCCTRHNGNGGYKLTFICEIKPNVQCGDGGLDWYNRIMGKCGQRCVRRKEENSIVRKLFRLNVSNALHSTWPVSVILFSFQPFAIATVKNVQNNCSLNSNSYLVTQSPFICLMNFYHYRRVVNGCNKTIYKKRIVTTKNNLTPPLKFVHINTRYVLPVRQ